MTKRERLLNAFENRPVDRVPIGFWHHFGPEVDSEEKMLQAHLDLYREAGMDMIKIMCDGYFNYPNPCIPQIKSPGDWFSLTPMGEDHPFITGQVERAKRITEAVSGECCVFYNVFCPMSLMRFGTSEELLMSHLREDPKAVCHAFQVIAEDVKTLVRKLITEAGCDGIYYCVQNAEKYRFTAEEYRSLVTPAELGVLEYANTLSQNNILHCCGWAGDPNWVEVWQDYPARVVNWAVYVEDLSLANGKRFFGGRCVLGGFDNRKTGLLYSGTRQEIEAETESLLQEAGSLGVILGADCTLPADVDPARIGWIREKLERLAAVRQ